MRIRPSQPTPRPHKFLVILAEIVGYGLRHTRFKTLAPAAEITFEAAA